jgi:condensin complex subunit 1
MRQAVIEVIGFLICELAHNDGQEADAKQTQKQINQLFNLLLERVLDLSLYVRAKVFAVLAKLTSLKSIKFPKQRLHITTAAVSALDDKGAAVRKGAAALLVCLLQTHPYGLMYGGMLQLGIWEADYKDAVAELDKIESQIGNVVNTGGEEQDEDEDEDEDHEAEEGGKKKRKRKSKKYDEIILHGQLVLIYLLRFDDDMNVDDDSKEKEGGDNGSDTEEDEPSQMSVDEDDEDAKKSKPKKASKLKPRKSELNITALSKEQAVLAKYSDQELTALRLRKKYYSDALTFIRQIEGAMEPMCKLLGSTNKAEVLEVMDFFRVAHEYQFESAKVGFYLCLVSGY